MRGTDIMSLVMTAVPNLSTCEWSVHRRVFWMNQITNDLVILNWVNRNIDRNEKERKNIILKFEILPLIVP